MEQSELSEPLEMPPSYPTGGTFSELLHWHLFVWGTRPADSTIGAEFRRAWEPSEFALAFAGREAKNLTSQIRKLAFWLDGKKKPADPAVLQKIKSALFDDRPLHKTWSDQLLKAPRERLSDDSEGGVAKSVPPPTTYFTGRAPEVEAIIGELLRPESSGAVLVQGGPGIGKTSLTQTVAHDARVIDRFGKSTRWFVQLETAPSAKAMQEAIALALGLSPSRPFDELLNALRSSPGLLILDNLETPWERPLDRDGRAATEAALHALGEVPGLAILASFRGHDSVGGLPWFVTHVGPLEAPHDRTLFTQIAGHEGADEPCLQQLLSVLGGIPLAIELVALQAVDGTPLVEIWKRWEAVGTALACHPDFDEGRLTSLPHSIELSLQSRRLSLEGYELFKLLGQLPAGLATSDRDAIMGSDAFNGALALMRTGLGLRRGDRVDLLPPIRDHAARHHRPDEIAGTRWSKHFMGLASEMADQAFSFDGADTRQRIIPEVPNIDAAIRHAVRQPSLLTDAVAASRHLRRLLTHTGMGTTATLHEVATACRNAGDSLGEARVSVQIGILAQERGDLDEAWQVLEQGLAANHRASNADDETNGKGDCLYRMADIHLHRSQLSEARGLYLQAKDFYDITNHARGLGDSFYRLGDIEWRRGNFAHALAYVDEAEPHFQRADFHLGVAHCAWLRARVALDAEDYDGAERLYLVVRKNFENIGVPLGLAHCRNEEGYIALARKQYGLARQCFEQACQMYVDIKDDRGIANCHLGLAKASRGEGDRTVAREWATKALAAYLRTNVIDCVGRCYEELARLCSDGHEASELALKAKDAFVKAGLEREVERITGVFLS